MTLESERAGDDADGQRSELSCDLCNDGCGTRARAASHAAGDEYHVGALDGFLNVLACFFRRLFTELGVHSRA